MTYVIGETCIDVKDKACVEVCPLDCIMGTDKDRMHYINPMECIDCGASVDPRPVDAIYAEEDLPPEWQEYTEINSLYFSDPEAARERVAARKPLGPERPNPALPHGGAARWLSDGGEGIRRRLA